MKLSTYSNSASKTLGFGLRVLALVTLLALSTVAHARVNVVTLPDRDTVQLTIYNSVDLTLVRETRDLTFRQGLNRLEFSWANTLIDPTSVEFKALTHSDDVEVLDVRFPPRVANTLEWHIQSEVAGSVTVEISYFTSGISWSADYVAEAVKTEEQMTLSGAVKVSNASGEDYENAQVRLVVGVVRLVEQIAELARRSETKKEATTKLMAKDAQLGQRFYRAARGALADAPAGIAGKPKEVVKEALSEYFLYTVEGRDTIETGWSKRLPSFRTEAVPITSYYKFEKERWGDQVMRYYRFTNSTPAKLGKEPLPDGRVTAFRYVSDDLLYAFVGRTAVKYIPINEAVEMELGPDQEVSVGAKLMDWQKADIDFDQRGDIKGWTVHETWQVEVQNSKEIPVMVDIRRTFPGDWALKTSAKYEAVDARKVKFLLPLKPREKQTFTYELVTNHGTRARR